MELGERLKQARLEAGLSQRQLCAGVVTRNMLSQIENGTAKPSMDTLKVLAFRLEKPLSWFLEEDPVTPAQNRILQARSAEPQRVLALLATGEQDPLLDPERYLLCALARMALARQALAQNRRAYAQGLLESAGEDGAKTPYFTQAMERERVLLLFQARQDLARDLLAILPRDPGETLLRAAAEPDPAVRGRILDADPWEDPRWYAARAEAHFQLSEFAEALECFHKAEQTRQTLQRQEECCRELGDYKGAYEYACKLRMINDKQ